jgi:Zn-dependent alcohol dehydrogenase
MSTIHDSVGDLNMSFNLMPSLTSKGKLVLIAQPQKDKSFSITNPNAIFGDSGTEIILTQGGNFTPSEDIPRYLSYLSTRTERIKQNISHRFTLDDINLAFKHLMSGDSNRILIYPNEL